MSALLSPPNVKHRVGSFNDHLEIVGAGTLGVDEMRGSMSETTVQWGLVRVKVGDGKLAREHTIFVHMMGEECAAVKRGKLNHFTEEARACVRDEDFEPKSIHAEIELHRVADVTPGFLLSHLKVIGDAGDFNVEQKVEQYNKFLRDRPARGKPTRGGSKHEEVVEESSSVRVVVPEHKTYSQFKGSGRDALKAVEDEDTLNWVLLRPNGKEGELVACGQGGIEEMAEALKDHEDGVLFGFLRMAFGESRFRRVKRVFVDFLSDHVSGVKKFHQHEMLGDIKGFMHTHLEVQILKAEDFTVDFVVEEVRGACIVDDFEAGPDGGKRELISVEAYREALAREREEAVRKLEVERSPPPPAPARGSSASEYSEWSLHEVMELVHHTDGPLDWVVIGARSDAKNTPIMAHVPDPTHQGIGQPAVFAGPGGGYLAAAKRNRSKSPRPEDSRDTAVVMTPFSGGQRGSASSGAPVAGGFDAGLAARLQRQKEKEASGESAVDDVHGAQAPKEVHVDSELAALLQRQKLKQDGEVKEGEGEQGEAPPVGKQISVPVVQVITAEPAPQ